MPTTAVVAVGPTPWSNADVLASLEYKLLMQFSSPKDIYCTVGNSLWPGVADLPPEIQGRVLQWQNKERVQLRINWQEPDGTWKYDTDDLHTLLAHGLKLIKGPRGEALHLRGAARAEAAAAATKRTIDVPYLEGALPKVQTWTVEPDPEAIVVDARTAPRFRATLNRRTEDVNTPYKMWRNAMLPPKLVDNMMAAFNLRLDGKSRRTRQTSKGEVVRFLSYMPALALHPGTPLKKAWQRVRGPKDVGPPLEMGIHGMSKERFETLLGLAGKVYPLNQAEVDTDNAWRFSEMPVDVFNEHMPTVITPGWNIGPDESGAAWRGKEGTQPHHCPHVSCIERKPEPICCELVDFACADSQCIMGMEINKGKVGMAHAKYTDEYSATAATNLRLSERYHFTQRTWGGDSWFTGLSEIEAGLAKGMWGYGDVKTHTTRVPIKELIEAVGPNSGDWAVFTTIVAGGHKVFAIGHRRGGTVHTYLSSHGQTLKGRPQSHKDDIESLGYMAVPRPCPMILNDWTNMQPVIDKQNRWRQRELAMEKYFVTQSFPFRLLTTIVGMTLGNAYAAFKRFVDKTDRSFLEFVNDVAFDGMHNDEHGPAPNAQMPSFTSPIPPNAPAEDTTPGAPSPLRTSPTRAASQHKVGPLRMLPGFIGNKQQWCSVCGIPASHCCTFCSEADKVFVLCNPSKRQCLTVHKANPTDEDHSYRRPHGKKQTGGESSSAKRARARSEQAASAPRPRKGSRSGATASFDSASFAPRARGMGMQGDSESEEEDEEEEEEEEEVVRGRGGGGGRARA